MNEVTGSTVRPHPEIWAVFTERVRAYFWCCSEASEKNVKKELTFNEEGWLGWKGWLTFESRHCVNLHL